MALCVPTSFKAWLLGSSINICSRRARVTNYLVSISTSQMEVAIEVQYAAPSNEAICQCWIFRCCPVRLCRTLHVQVILIANLSVTLASNA